jgi:hypothetical protein
LTINLRIDSVVVQLLDSQQYQELIHHLTRIERKVDTIMATQEDFDARMAQLDAATNAIAADLAALKGQITGQGLSAEAEANVLATLDAKIAALNALATPGGTPVA